ncbi:DNase1 protein [Xylariaceae sp. FL0594]|nr:DNase1 protein [Xylariaceae sp. FL0594]
MFFSLSLLFSLFSLFAVLVGSLAANSINFVNQDGVLRTLIFTPNAGLEWLPSVDVPGHQEKNVTFPPMWCGNAYAVAEGAPIKPGMLAEFCFGNFDAMTFFDISAIVDPTDINGVKEMFPLSQLGLEVKVADWYSGCKVFPCNTAYYAPDDPMTRASRETDFIVTLGTPDQITGVVPREDRAKAFDRKYVLGQA